MSKIICDVCGTSFPETATQCPICGCVRPGDVVTVAGDTKEKENQSGATYTYVKGGRFSKTNVKKRNQGKTVPPVKAESKEIAQEEKAGKGEKGLMIAIIVLLLAICIVVTYILLHFFAPGLFGEKQTETTAPVMSTVETEDDTQTTSGEVSCTQILLSKSGFTFDKSGASYLLNITLYPNDTTDPVNFESGDEQVATVTQEGKITAVGSGTTVITVTCGDVVEEFTVDCAFEDEGTEPSETTEPEEITPTTPSDTEFKLNREDFTMSQKGDTWKLYNGEIPQDQITWTSDDEKVVTVKNGIVTAVGKGMTKIHAEYGGTKVSCIVRCSDAVGTADTQTPSVETDTQNSGYVQNKTDVTIKIGETFALTLMDANGNPVNVTWVAANGAICTITGNNVTGAASGMTKVKATHGGYEFSCIVRVK